MTTKLVSQRSQSEPEKASTLLLKAKRFFFQCGHIYLHNLFYFIWRMKHITELDKNNHFVFNVIIRTTSITRITELGKEKTPEETSFTSIDIPMKHTHLLSRRTGAVENLEVSNLLTANSGPHFQGRCFRQDRDLALHPNTQGQDKAFDAGKLPLPPSLDKSCV